MLPLTNIPGPTISTSTLAPSTTKDKSTQYDNKRSRRSFSQIALHTPPSFFSVNMGTGITSILLYKLPYNTDWIQWIAVGIFVLNVVIFVLLSIMTVWRYMRWRGVWRITLRHGGGAGMYWGCMPMGLATIINMICYVCVPAFGIRFAHLVLALWYLDLAFSILINFSLLFTLIARQSHTPETIAATWLLPIVSSVVAAASGGVVADVLSPYHPGLARGTLILAYMTWGTGVPVAMMLIGIWIFRSAMYGPPADKALGSVFLPLGPCGQGAFGIALLGRVTRDLSANHSTLFDAGDSAIVAQSIYAAGLLTALILWGLGLVFYCLAFALVIDNIRTAQSLAFFSHKNYSIGLWALTFPIGVFATATTQLAAELENAPLRVVGMILSCQVVVHWVYVAIMTVWKVVDGTLFDAPELKGLEQGEVRRRWEKSQV